MYFYVYLLSVGYPDKTHDYAIVVGYQGLQGLHCSPKQYLNNTLMSIVISMNMYQMFLMVCSFPFIAFPLVVLLPNVHFQLIQSLISCCLLESTILLH